MFEKNRIAYKTHITYCLAASQHTKSTIPQTAIVAVHDSIVRAIDSEEVCALVLQTSARPLTWFIMRHVLTQRFGINDLALTWFSLYLVSPRGSATQMYAVNCSVLQGSVLVPVEFIAYTDELGEVIDSFYFRHLLYADDNLVSST